MISGKMLASGEQVAQRWWPGLSFVFNPPPPSGWLAPTTQQQKAALINSFIIEIEFKREKRGPFVPFCQIKFPQIIEIDFAQSVPTVKLDENIKKKTMKTMKLLK